MQGHIGSPVLGPNLFLIYINDLVKDIQSTVRLFADDCLIYRPIHTPADHSIFQNDLQKLLAGAEKWKMKFNVYNCCIMQLSKHFHKRKFLYSMSGQDLKIVEQHPYLIRGYYWPPVIMETSCWLCMTQSNETDRISESQFVCLLKNFERIELQTVCVTNFRLCFIYIWDLPTWSPITVTISSNDLKFHHYQPNIDCFKHSFFVRTIPDYHKMLLMLTQLKVLKIYYTDTTIIACNCTYNYNFALVN